MNYWAALQCSRCCTPAFQQPTFSVQFSAAAVNAQVDSWATFQSDFYASSIFKVISTIHKFTASYRSLILSTALRSVKKSRFWLKYLRSKLWILVDSKAIELLRKKSGNSIFLILDSIISQWSTVGARPLVLLEIFSSWFANFTHNKSKTQSRSSLGIELLC